MIMNNKNPFEVFKNEAPEVFEGFNTLIQSLINAKGLDPKTKQLIYIGMKAAQGDESAVFFHVPLAKNAGATRNEIKEAILLTLPVCGVKGINTCLVKALDAYDNIT